MRLIDLDDYSHTFCGYDGEYEKWNIDPDAIVPAIEPKKGKWIMNKVSPRGRNYTCQYCECVAIKPYKFCPNCGSYNGGGADMREGETE